MPASPLFRRLVLVLLVLWAIPFRSAAQDRTDGDLLVFQIEGLTSATRDALVQDLAGDLDLQVVFACVPAGLLAFRARNNEDRTRAEMLVHDRANGATAHRTDLELAALEQACSQVRGQ